MQRYFSLNKNIRNFNLKKQIKYYDTQKINYRLVKQLYVRRNVSITDSY